jgi:hypothetical protein
MAADVNGTTGLTVDMRYPIGRFARPESITAADRDEALGVLAAFPAKLRATVQDMPDTQLDTPYREGGWTVRQLVSHVADSHLMAMLRMKMALTMDWPQVPGYDEKAFALLADAAAPVAPSLAMLDGLHAHLDLLLRSLDDAAWQRGITHAERGRMTIESLALLYAWHSRHHLAHITELQTKMSW